jgi:hypothetical protein
MGRKLIYIYIVAIFTVSCKENIEIIKYPNGVIKSEVYIDDEGEPHGVGVFYDTLGRVKIKTNFIHGHVNGWGYKYYDGVMGDSSFFVNDTIRERYCFNKDGVLLSHCIDEAKCCFYQYYKNGNVYEKYFSTDIKNERGEWLRSVVDSIFVYSLNGKLVSYSKAEGDTLRIKIGNESFLIARNDTVRLIEINKYRKKLLGKDTCEFEWATCK